MVEGGQQATSISSHLQTGSELFDSDPKGALAAYYQAVTIEPSHIEGWNQIGRLMFDLQQYAEAEMVFSRVEQLAKEQNLPDWAEMAGQNVELTRETLEAAAPVEEVQEPEIVATDEPIAEEKQPAPSEEAKSIEDISNIASVVQPVHAEVENQAAPIESAPLPIEQPAPAAQVSPVPGNPALNAAQAAEVQSIPIETSFVEVAPVDIAPVPPVPVHQEPVKQDTAAVPSPSMPEPAIEVENQPMVSAPMASAPMTPAPMTPAPMASAPIEVAIVETFSHKSEVQTEAVPASQTTPTPQIVQAVQAGQSTPSSYGGVPLANAMSPGAQQSSPQLPNMPIPPNGQTAFHPGPPPTPYPAQPGAAMPGAEQTLPSPVPPTPAVDAEMDAPKAGSGKIALMITGVVGAVGIGIGAAQYLNSSGTSETGVPVIKSEVKLAANTTPKTPAPAAKAAVPTPENADRDQAYKIGMTHLVKGEFVKAREYLEKAEDKGHGEAGYNLASLYAKGDGVEQDFTKAAGYLKKAANGGYTPAMTNLGLLYAQGQGVEQNYLTARSLWLKAAAGEHPDAMHNLAVIYATGKGVDKDMTEAIKWYRKGANAGYVDSIANLGLIYANGDGVTRDYAEAKRLWETAAGKGHKVAAQNLEKLKQVMQ